MDQEAISEHVHEVAKQFNSGGPIAPVLASDIKQLRDVVRRMNADMPPRPNVAVGLGVYEAYGLEAASARPEQMMSIGLRLELVSALASRGVLNDYKHGEELDEKVFLAAAKIPLNKHDLGEAMLPLRLAQMPADVVTKATEAMHAEGRDPAKPDIDGKFLDWLRDCC